MRLAGYVYFARCGDLVKIGATTNIGQRISQLGTNIKIRHQLVAAIPATDHYLLERKLHHRFARHRFTGEYFRLTDADIVTAPEIRKLIEVYRDHVILRRAERQPPRFWRKSRIDLRLCFRVHPEDESIWMDYQTRSQPRLPRSCKVRAVVPYTPAQRPDDEDVVKKLSTDTEASE